MILLIVSSIGLSEMFQMASEVKQWPTLHLLSDEAG
jgi:hypothetical protein